MSRRVKGSKVLGLLGWSGLLSGMLMAPPALAHKVETAADVGGTQHIEPNDNPMAGEPSLVWFALRQKGGDPITLEDCRCQLAVYAVPRREGDTPVLTPILKSVTAEGSRGIPGAEVAFPAVGAYELVLRGEPAEAETFQPFELKFEVTVAAGVTRPSPEATPAQTPEHAKTTEQPENQDSRLGELGAIALCVLFVGGAVWAKRRKAQ